MGNTLTQLMQLARPRRQLTDGDAPLLTASRLQAIDCLPTDYMNIGHRALERGRMPGLWLRGTSGWAKILGRLRPLSQVSSVVAQPATAVPRFQFGCAAMNH